MYKRQPARNRTFSPSRIMNKSLNGQHTISSSRKLIGIEGLIHRQYLQNMPLSQSTIIPLLHSRHLEKELSELENTIKNEYSGNKAVEIEATEYILAALIYLHFTAQNGEKDQIKGPDWKTLIHIIETTIPEDTETIKTLRKKRITRKQISQWFTTVTHIFEQAGLNQVDPASIAHILEKLNANEEEYIHQTSYSAIKKFTHKAMQNLSEFVQESSISNSRILIKGQYNTSQALCIAENYLETYRQKAIRTKRRIKKGLHSGELILLKPGKYILTGKARKELLEQAIEIETDNIHTLYLTRLFLNLIIRQPFQYEATKHLPGLFRTCANEGALFIVLNKNKSKKKKQYDHIFWQPLFSQKAYRTIPKPLTSLLKDRGRIHLVLPDFELHSKRLRLFREKILQQGMLRSIHTEATIAPLKRQHCEYCLLSFAQSRKGSLKVQSSSSHAWQPVEKTMLISNKEYLKTKNLSILSGVSSKDLKLLNLLEKTGHKLSDIGIITNGNIRNLKRKAQAEASTCPVYIAQQIQRFSLIASEYITADTPEQSETLPILIADSLDPGPHGTIRATVNRKKAQYHHSVITVYLTNKHISPYYILGLLQSDTIYRYLRLKNRGFKLYQQDLTTLPVPDLHMDNEEEMALHDTIVSCADELTELYPHLSNPAAQSKLTLIIQHIGKLEKLIDKSVEELFMISPGR